MQQVGDEYCIGTMKFDILKVTNIVSSHHEPTFRFAVARVSVEHISLSHYSSSFRRWSIKSELIDFVDFNTV